jgi:hypothetical protein
VSEPLSRRWLITATEDLVRSRLWCSACGQLDPPTDGHARRHAGENPDHEVSMTREIEIHYFARQPSDLDLTS